MKFFLVKNLGYKWFFDNDSAFKGYFFEEITRKVFREQEALCYLKQVQTFDELKHLLKGIDGSFSFVIRRGEDVWAGVDVARSMPIFYTTTGDFLSDSVKEITNMKGLTDSDLDYSAVEEYIHTYYIGHNRTLYSLIKQLDAGQILEFSQGKFNVEYYYIHKADIVFYEREEALRKFTSVSEDVFDEVIRIANGRPIVLSLSGGYDSRYVACMLKERGAKDVSCYSYGKGETFEVLKSKQIAERLGYRWIFVDYTDKLLNKYLNGSYIDFFDVYEGRDSVPYIQNYVAVKYLEEKHWFKPNSVFITGLCNDMQTGFYSRLESDVKDFVPTPEFLVKFIIQRRNMHNRLGKKALEEYKVNLMNVIYAMGLKVNNYQEFVSAADSIEAILVHSRLFLHMNDIHAAMGYEWVLPCWNKKSLGFWYSLPIELRNKQNLYEEWQLFSVPLKYGIAEKKTLLSYTLYTSFDRMKARIRLLFKRLVLYPLGLSMEEDIDYNNFNYISAKYFQKIREKSVLKFRNLSINSILALYTAEKWIGVDVCKSKIYRYEKKTNY